jgi:hypothetical protein
MTKEELRAWAIRHGYQQDRFGHMKRLGGTIRLKFQKISVRSEAKGNSRWFPRWSAYYSNLRLETDDTLSFITRNAQMNRITHLPTPEA